MLILGSFLGSDNCYSPTPVSINEITYFSLGQGEYDGIYATSDIGMEQTYHLNTRWDMNTIFAGEFDHNINLGNVDFTLSTVSHIAIKRREAGTFQWTTIFVKDIHTLNDFNINGIDILNASNTMYQYALVPILNRMEGNYHIVESYSKFDGVFLLEKDTIYGTTLDVKCDTSRNHYVLKQEYLYNKYPKSIYHSSANYESGTVEGYFCRYDTEKCEFYFDDSIPYRKAFVDFLTDQKPKILKLFDGRIWLVNIDGNPITDTEGGHWLHRITSFSFYESGDYQNERDLYDGNLIDVKSDFWSYGL